MAKMYIGDQEVAPVVPQIVSKKICGVSIDNMLPYDGLRVSTIPTFEFDATSITHVPQESVVLPNGETVYGLDPFYYRFYGNKALVGTVDLSNYKGTRTLSSSFHHTFEGTSVEKVILPPGESEYADQLKLNSTFMNAEQLHTVVISSSKIGDTYVGLPDTFSGCIKLTNVIGLGNVDEVFSNGLLRTFYDCDSLTTADTANIKTVANYGMQECFAGSGIINADLSGITHVNSYSFSKCYQNCFSLKTANLSNVQYVGQAGLYYCFNGSGVEVLDITSVQEVSYEGLKNVCQNANSLKTVVGLELLEIIRDSGFEYAFYGCTSLTGDFVFTSLATLGSSAFRYGFQGCTSPLRFFFPALTTLGTNPFGTSSTNSAFRNATGVTEIHFRADMQSQVESLSQYSSKWGATNATIYFDL